LSPDGRWAAYVSYDGSRPATFVRALPDDGRRWAVADDTSMLPQWSPAGELFVQAGSHVNAVAYRVTSGGFHVARPRQWSPQPIDGAASFTAFAMAPDGSRAVVVLPNLAAAERTRHVVSLWTNAVEEFRRRAPLDAER
jgi:hypothetical protein